MIAPIYIPTNSAQGFPFLHIFANICYVYPFWWKPFWQVWGDILILLCVSLMTSDADHLFMCLLAICIYSLEECLISSSAHFLTGFFAFWWWVVWGVCICWILTSYWSCCWNVFSQSVRCLFVLLMVFFAMQKLLSLIRSHLFTFAFTFFDLGDWPKKTLICFTSKCFGYVLF